jgi:hypothetical protein
MMGLRKKKATKKRPVKAAAIDVSELIAKLESSGIRWRGCVKLDGGGAGFLAGLLGKASVNFDTTFTIPK